LWTCQTKGLAYILMDSNLASVSNCPVSHAELRQDAWQVPGRCQGRLGPWGKQKACEKMFCEAICNGAP
jgi:hypothetical protein